MKTITIAATMITLALGLTTNGFAGGKGGNGHSNFRGNSGRNIQFQRTFQQPKFQIPNHHVQRQVQHHVVQPRFPQQRVPQFGHRNITFARPHFQQSQVRFNNYHLTHGTKFAGGYCYYGRNHNHWVATNYCQQLNCNIFYCPCTHCWYYWSDAYGCYLPVNAF